MRNIEKWAERLGVASDMPRDEDSFYAVCPCHKDTKPSLHVYVGCHGNIFMKCRVCGATGASICAKLNVPASDLAADEPFDNEEQEVLGEDEPDSITKQLIERLGRANGKAYGPGDMKSAAMWSKGVEVAKDVILAMAVYIAGNPARVRDELIDELAKSLAGRARARAIRELNEMEKPLIEVAPGVFNK